MEEGDKRFSWRRFEKAKFSSKDLGKRVRKIEKSTLRHARRFVSSRLDRLTLVRRVVVGWVALVLMLAGVSMAQWVGFRQAYMVESPVVGGTYSEGVLGPLEGLNPIFARSSAERSASRLLFSSLYTYDATGDIKGDLAKSISANEPQNEYTVVLKKGLRWSDGTPITAKDVVFTVGLLKDPKVRSEIAGWASIKAEQVDVSTVKFILPGAYAPFMHALTFPILPEHVLSEVPGAELHEHDFSQNPVTSGPFALRMLQAVSSDGTRKVAHMVASPYYHRGSAKLERFQLHVYGAKEDIEQGLRTSEIMATPELSFDSQDDRIKNIYLKESYPINNGVYAIMNTRAEILKDRLVREALSLSVDRGSLISKLPHSASQLDGPVLNSHTSGLPEAPAKNIDRAKQLLDEAGWSVVGGIRKKDGQDLTLSMIALKGAGSSQVASELAKSWQKELSVKVEVEMVDPSDTSQSVLQTVLQPRSFDILLYELVLGGDPDSYAYWHSTQATMQGLNFSNYSNVIADDALAGGRSRNDSRYRGERYRSFAKQWLKDVPAVGLYQPKIDYIFSKNVQGMTADVSLISPADRFYDVIYWSIGGSSVYRTP